ncbi:hypothetical protein [Archangium lansingense]|uniref:Lipoprotein n=1 Tax=Archangium lansingense TaxID=2995310 RepID=A0ABT3ZUM8_9BACT|nr:hypothetical protein [Archangium lansinium]MCY1073109.1 hypothetical protein [Archangium lansinium]
MTKSLRVLAVVSLLLAGCGESELAGAEPAASRSEQAQSAPPREEGPGTIQAMACITLYNQDPQPTCQTRDYWKMNTASYCPSGYYGSAVTTHDACSTPGYYRYADITCCQ